MALDRIEPKNTTGHLPNFGKITPLRQGFYIVENIDIPGAAPKDFIKVYEYGEGIRKDDPDTWPGYIAKVGHKWYPGESITEQLMTRIGEICGFNVAQSKLMLVKGQLRFFSKYFLDPNHEVLVHGSEIFTAYLQDEQFVQQIEDEDKTRELLTFQTTIEAIEEVYKECCDDIMSDFVDMLFFDAITGNNDRHFENWGVIEDVIDPSANRFSPIYDTARGIFWNFPEDRLISLMNDDNWLNSYIESSMPATSWDNKEELNHFGLIRFLLTEYPKYCESIVKFNFSKATENVNNLINREFKDLFSKNRRLLQRKYLTKRIRKLQDIVRDHDR